MTDACDCPWPARCREDGLCYLDETRGIERDQSERFRDYNRRRREIERRMADTHRPLGGTRRRRRKP